MEIALEVYENRSNRISTSKLNAFVQDIVGAVPPPTYRGNFVLLLELGDHFRCCQQGFTRFNNVARH